MLQTMYFGKQILHCLKHPHVEDLNMDLCCQGKFCARAITQCAKCAQRVEIEELSIGEFGKQT